jgi:hypothetical protein
VKKFIVVYTKFQSQPETLVVQLVSQLLKTCSERVKTWFIQNSKVIEIFEESFIDGMRLWQKLNVQVGDVSGWCRLVKCHVAGNEGGKSYTMVHKVTILVSKESGLRNSEFWKCNGQGIYNGKKECTEKKKCWELPLFSVTPWVQSLNQVHASRIVMTEILYPLPSWWIYWEKGKIRLKDVNVSHGEKSMFIMGRKNYLQSWANGGLFHRGFTSEAVSFRWKVK